MKKQIKKRICFFALSVLLVVFMVGETFAYDWTQIEQVTNEFETGSYITDLEEEFTSPSDWLPGTYTNKDVWVSNDGTVPVFAKIEISQEWIRRENVYDEDGNIIQPEAGETFTLNFTTEDGEEYAAVIDWGEDVVVLSSGVSDTLSLGLPTVDSLEEAQGKWLLIDENTDGNYVFYYIGVIDSEEETPLLIEGVEMNFNIENSTLEKNTVWDKENEVWVTTTVQNPSNDYENSTYTLSVTMSTVQATSNAVLETFNSDTVTEQAVISYLQTLAITGEDVTYSRDDVDEKILYLSEGDGELLYTPAEPEENWFMSFLNMIPGETYTDSMVISNQSDSTYNIYMQAIIKGEQSEIAEELLEYIQMTVYYNGEILYSGTAKGEDYQNTLFDVIYLGEYLSGEENMIEVILTLDKDTPIEYSNILATTDWQFMVEEDVETINVPQTGDDTSFAMYIILMLLSATGLLICILKIKSTK